MKKIVITCLLLCVALVGMAVPTFAESYDMIESNYANKQNYSNIKSDYSISNNFSSNKINHNSLVTNIGQFNKAVINTQYSYSLNADLKYLYNNADFGLNTGTNATTTSAYFNISDYQIYYYLSSFYVTGFDNDDAFVSESLITYIANNDLNPTIGSVKGLSVALGQIGLNTGDVRAYQDIYGQGYRQFKQYSFYHQQLQKTIYITEFAHMANATDQHLYTNNINSNFQKSLYLDRCDIQSIKIADNWTYADFTLSSQGNMIYDKSNNISILSYSNGSYNLRILNNNESGYITFAYLIDSYSVSSSNVTTLSIPFNFYYDDSISVNDYSNILTSINNNCLGIVTNTDDIKTLLNTNNTLTNNIYQNFLYYANEFNSQLRSINTNSFDIASNSLSIISNLDDIKEMLSDLQVNEINNIYTDIQNTYNIDIDLEIKDLIHDLQLNIGNVSTTDNVSIDTKTDLNTLSNNLIKPLFDEINTNNLQILYILPLACGVILLLL